MLSFPFIQKQKMNKLFATNQAYYNVKSFNYSHSILDEVDRSVEILLSAIPVGLSLFLPSSAKYKMLLWFLKHNGPLFIKLGQWLSTRRDLCSPELCKQLYKLHETASVHSFHDTLKSIRMAEIHLTDICKVPIGSGSVAQVHEAVYDGATVAVKVLHPGVEKQMHLDFVLLERFVRFLSKFPSTAFLDLDKQLQNLKIDISKQLDLKTEAHNLQLLRRNLNEYAYVPKVIVCTSSVLVEEYVVHKDFRRPSRKIIDDLVNCVVKMVVSDGFVHADMHPGNLKIAPSNRLIIFDGGLCKRFNADEHKNLVDLLVELLLNRSTRNAGRLLIERHVVNRVQVTDRARFETDFEKAMQPFFNRPMSEVSVVGTIMRVCKLLNEHNVKLDTCYSNTLFSLGCLEGLLKRYINSSDLASMVSSAIYKHFPLHTLFRLCTSKYLP